MLQSGSNCTTDGISQGHIDAVTSRRTTLQILASIKATPPLVGNRGPKDALSDLTQRYLFGFWTLVDQILNSILFLLIGLEVLVLRFDAAYLPLSLLAIPIAVAARLVATASAVAALKHWYDFPQGTVVVLVWGGLRGGISIALALALPETEWKPVLLSATYFVVVFTILVQGLTLGHVAKRVLKHGVP